MDTTNAILDASAMNRFISSLSKSLQALCHGCMDFDNGIEMIGYININIDSENSVDCILNEKVKRRSETNSMTFVSNSFLARKEKAKVTREVACSPIPELENRDYTFRKWHSFDHFNRKGTGKKRHRKEHLNTNHNTISQGRFEDFPSDHPETFEHQSDLNFQHHIKQEVDESSLSANVSSTAIKHEYSDLQTQDLGKGENKIGIMCSGSTSSDHPGMSSSHEYEHDQPSAELTSLEQVAETVPPRISQHLQGKVENFDDENGEQSNINTGDCPEDMNEQSSLLEEGETSNVPDEFEVIEIGDDDEVQGFFAHPGASRELGSTVLASSCSSGPEVTGDNTSSSRKRHNLPRPQMMSPNTPVHPETFPSSSVSQSRLSEYKPFACHLCSKGFHSQTGLRYHIEAHGGRKFRCHVCESMFKHKHHLKQHLRALHKLIQCVNCSQAFTVGEAYNRHVLHCL